MINLKRTVVLNSLILMLNCLRKAPTTAELTTRTLTARKEAN